MSKSRLVLLGICLVGLIVGARLAVYAHFGTDLPDWDQWDAEGMAIFLPWSLGQLHWTDFFTPQNEHRVVLTHGMAFVITALNGQWDQRVEAVALAFMPAGIALLWWRMAARRLSRRWQIGFFLLLAATSALPVAWQNVLNGFSSAQFFLTGLAMGTVALLPFSEPYEGRWWGGVSCAVLGLGSLGSGFFASAVTGGMLVFQVWRGSRRWGSAAPGLVICLLVTFAGFLLRVIVPSSDPLKAHSIGDFVMTVARALGWPAFDVGWGLLSLALVLPWVLITARLLNPRRRRQPADPWLQFLSGMGWWVLFQVMAAGYARGADGPPPASRYLDTLIVGSVVNLLCLHTLWLRSDLALPRRQVLAVGVGTWAMLFGLGLAGETYGVFTEDLPPLIAYRRACEEHVRNYLATGDEDYLRHPYQIPYPVEWAMKRDLDYAGLADLLPASVRRPLPLAAQPASGGFVRVDSRGPEPRADLRSHGPAPGATSLDNAVAWSSFGAAAGASSSGPWSSQPITLHRTEWLRFWISGDLDARGAQLQLRAAASGHAVVPIKSSPSGPGWRPAWVRVPAGSWVVTARPSSDRSWFAFSEPVEMSLGSSLAWILTRQGIWLTWGAGLLAAGVLLTVPKRVGDNALHR